METLVEGKVDEENNIKETSDEKSNSSFCMPKQTADPIVYQLVRVEGDGRLVPATDDELMEVEDLLEDEKGELPLSEDPLHTEGSISFEGFSSEKANLEGSEDLPGLLQSENMEVNARKLNSRFEETLPPQSPRFNDNDATQISTVEMCLERNDRPIVGESLISNTHSTSKPDFSTIKGEICLDNLSIRELHETFRATFGRETSVKDKLWLKRRIAMGLTNSCNVPTTSFIIKDKKLVCKKENDSESMVENSKTADGSQTKNEIIGVINDDGRDNTTEIIKSETQQVLSGKRFRNPQSEFDGNSNTEDDMKGEHLHMPQAGAKRLRKPTRRYIEELSEVENRECSGKPVTAFKNSGHGQSSPKPCVKPVGNVDCVTSAVVTRHDSLGGSGVQIPYVSRMRRGRPRENFMTLMKYHPGGMAAKLVNRALSMQQDDESGNKMLKSEALPQLTDTKAEIQLHAVVTNAAEQQQDLEPEKVYSSKDDPAGNTATVATSKGGTRRKHHRAWTLCEVMKLVDGVSKYGAGRWSEIKRLAFASYSYRTSVDLKDKWRNLLRASLSQAPSDQANLQAKSSRRHASIPIPTPILVRVRELAEMHPQVTSDSSSSKWAGHGRTVHESREVNKSNTIMI